MIKQSSSLLNKNEVANRKHAWQMIIERKRRDDKNGEKEINRQQLPSTQ